MRAATAPKSKHRKVQGYVGVCRKLDGLKQKIDASRAKYLAPLEDRAIRLQEDAKRRWWALSGGQQAEAERLVGRRLWFRP